MKKMTRSILLAATLIIASSALMAEDEAVEVKLTAEKTTFAYDKKEFTVKAGSKVKLTLVNPTGSVQPHNIIIVKPGKKDAVGMIANQSMADPKFLTNPIPVSDDVLFSSKLVQPGAEETIEFTAPEEAGDYPYLCTYPGHWIIMNGVMKVEK